MFNSVVGYESVPVPFGVQDWLTFWLIFIISLLNGILMLFAGYKFLQILQLSGYKTKGYWTWLKEDGKKYWGRLVVLSFLSTAALLITNVLLNMFFVYKILTYIGLIFYFGFTILFIFNMYTAPQKVPLKYTRRMNRLCVVLTIVVIVFSFAMLSASTIFVPYLEYGAVGLTPVILPLFVLLAFWITVPFENLNSHRYIIKAKNKINSHNDLIVIGITGSYAKTSVKNILNTILSIKYKTCATPYSYNTPLGLSKTILETLKENDQILIAEMGAKYVGDIKYLCDMVRPNIGIVTGIGNQHLSTFGSIENIVKTKYELVENIALGGKVYFNGDSAGCCEMYEKTAKDKFLTGMAIPSGRATASDIKVFADGSSFRLTIDNKSVDVKTNLLGEHNVSNILLCALVAYDLGESLDDIALGISKLVAPAHRLALVPSANSLVVIDDAYNGSVEGSKAALKVVQQYSSTKFIITPGLVELGEEGYQANYNLGKEMAGVADYVIIDGVVNFDAIFAGLKDAEFDMTRCLRAGNLKQSVDVLNTIAKPGDVVLFENDLPDNYT